MSGKRDRLGDDSVMIMQPKRRFIWPDSLHREFVASIFDAGLKHLVETESEHKYHMVLASHKQATVEQIQRHVHKILAYRVDTKHKDVPDLRRRTNQFFLPEPGGAAEHEEKTPLLDRASHERMDVEEQAGEGEGGGDRGLRRHRGPTVEDQVESVSEKLQEMREALANAKRYESRLKSNIDKQAKLVRKLSKVTDRIQALHPTAEGWRTVATSSLSSSSAVLHAPPHIRSSSSKPEELEELRLPPEISIIDEFAANMEVHRKLLLRKEEQVNRHGSIVDADAPRVLGPGQGAVGVGGVGVGAVPHISSGGTEQEQASEFTSFYAQLPPAVSKEGGRVGSPSLLSSPVGDGGREGKDSTAAAGAGAGAALEHFDQLDMDDLFGFLMEGRGEEASSQS